RVSGPARTLKCSRKNWAVCHGKEQKRHTKLCRLMSVKNTLSQADPLGTIISKSPVKSLLNLKSEIDDFGLCLKSVQFFVETARRLISYRRACFMLQKRKRRRVFYENRVSGSR